MKLMKLFNKFISRFSFFRDSIKYRLLLYFLFLVFLPTSIISTTVYYKSKNIIMERVQNSTLSNLNMIETSFKQKVEEISDVMQLIYMSPDFQDILSSPYFTSQSQNVLSPLYSDKNSYLVNEMIALDRILDGYSNFGTGNTKLIPNFYIYNRVEYLLFNVSQKVTDLISIQDEDWYSKIPSKCKYSIVGLNTQETQSGELFTLRIAKRLYGLKNSQIPYAGLLTVDVGIDNFNSIAKNFKPSPNSIIYILDADNNIISCSDESLLGTKLSINIFDVHLSPKVNKDSTEIKKTENGTDDSMIISYKKMADLNYFILSLSPTSEMYGELVSFNMVMAIVLVICLIVSLLFSILLSENISYPIRKLVKSMSVVQDGNFNVSIKYKRSDEFSFLISTYNKMVQQIKDLIQKLYISELNKKEAELKSLQAQINPHFLYNTLDSINWLAIKHDVPDISTMVTSLSDFFRYSLNKGRDIISLSDEKKQVESYLEILRTRFKEKIDYNIAFDPQVLDCLSVKLILQPIVENAILHGIEQRRGKGTINISAVMKNDIIEIVISDDGVGANITELNKILLDTTSTKSYGLKNVNERIKYTFGEKYGLAFTPNEPCGVKAIIIIPVTRTLEVEV